MLTMIASKFVHRFCEMKSPDRLLPPMQRRSQVNVWMELGSMDRKNPSKPLKQAWSHSAIPASNPYSAQAGLMDFILPLY